METIRKGENIIMLGDMEEKGSTVKKRWDCTMHKHDRLKGS